MAARGLRRWASACARIFVCMLLLVACKAESDDKFEDPELSTSLIVAIAYPDLIERCDITLAGGTGPVGPIASGYGAFGPNGIAVKKIANPSFARDVCIYHAPASTAAPVIFLLHGFSSPSAEPYMPLISFAVSKGYTVVYPLYFSDSREVTENYSVMSAGIEGAIAAHPELMDLTKVGYMEHSYGGGAVPFLAHDGVVNRGRGTAGNFMFIMGALVYF